MFTSMLWIESKKIFRQPILWIELGILAVIAAMIPPLLYVASQVTPAQAGGPGPEAMRASLVWPGALVEALGTAGAGGLGGLLLVVLAGSAITQEYQWRTLHFWLSRGVPRGAFLLARFASLLAPALLLAAGALAAGGLSSLAVSAVGAGAPRVDLVNWGQLALGLLRAAYTVLPYAALALLLGTATRSPAATIGVGIAFALLIENVLAQIFALMGGPLAGLIQFMPMAMASTLMDQNAAITLGQATEASAVSMLEPLAAAAGLALYTLLFLALAYGQLKRQDLTG